MSSKVVWTKWHIQVWKKSFCLTFLLGRKGKKKRQTWLYSHTLPPSKTGECKTHYIHQQEWKWTTLQNYQGDGHYVSTFSLSLHSGNGTNEWLLMLAPAADVINAPTEWAVCCLKSMACVITENVAYSGKPAWCGNVLWSHSFLPPLFVLGALPLTSG